MSYRESLFCDTPSFVPGCDSRDTTRRYGHFSALPWIFYNRISGSNDSSHPMFVRIWPNATMKGLLHNPHEVFDGSRPKFEIRVALKLSFADGRTHLETKKSYQHIFLAMFGENRLTQDYATRIGT